LEQIDPVQAWINSARSLRKNIVYICLNAILYLVCAGSIIIFGFFYLSDIALLGLVAFYLHLWFLLMYATRETLAQPVTLTIQPRKNLKFLQLYKLLLFLGIIAYTALTSLGLRNYQAVINMYTTWQKERDFAIQFETFTNKEYNYSIAYPKKWSIYPRINNNSHITFYYNENNTTSGRISADVIILSHADIDFNRLDVIEPGTEITDTIKNEKIIKLENLSLGGHDAVKYTLTRAIDGQTEIQINYAIRKQDQIYKISFITADPIIQQNYTNTFDRMIQSFSFTSSTGSN
jgi:hypothetical protein